MEEQIAASLCCSGATPLVGERPRSNGQTTAWPAAPSRACIGEFKVMRAPLASCCDRVVAKLTPYRRARRLERKITTTKSATAPPAPSPSCQQPLHRPGGPSRSSSIAPPKPINQKFAAPDSFGTHAPRDKENQPASPKCRRESTPEPPMLFWRDPSRWRATP